MALGILREGARQARNGEVTIVGDPLPRPLDVCVMPDSMGGVEYLVSEVTHELSNDSGYTSKLGLGGLLDDIEVSTWQTVTGPDSGTAAQPPGDGDGDDGEGDVEPPDNPDGGTAPPPDDSDDGGDESDDGDDSDDGPSGPRIISP